MRLLFSCTKEKNALKREENSIKLFVLVRIHLNGAIICVDKEGVI